MPELPEVETVMRGLAAILDGSRIADAGARRADIRFPLPERLAERLRHKRILGFRRRAKYMLMRLDSGESLLIHLGMSGRMVARKLGAPVVPRMGPQGQYSDARGHNAPPDAHEHVWLTTEDGWHVGFVDPRRFGCMDLVATDGEDTHKLLRGLGPEPLDEAFDAATLSAALAGKRTPVKAALLDQTVVAGIGNIYACEALFRAGISPRRIAKSCVGERAARLAPAIKAVLSESIGAGGSTLRDYVRADGEIGGFQERFDVYDREGQPCSRCPGPPGCKGIARIVQSGRSTFYCPKTQR